MNALRSAERLLSPTACRGLAIVLAFVLVYFFNDKLNDKAPGTLLPADSRAPISTQPVHGNEAGLPETFIVAQYQNAVAEIKLRIEREHDLYVFKFFAVGAVLALIFGSAFGTGFFGIAGLITGRRSKSALREGTDGSEASTWQAQATVAALCSWTAVDVAALIDIRMRVNARVIGTLGAWIEGAEKWLAPDVTGWEQYLRVKSSLSRGLIAPLQRGDSPLMTWVFFSLVLLAFSPNLANDETPGVDQPAARQIKRFGPCSALLLLLLYTLQLQADSFAAAWPPIAAFLATVACVLGSLRVTTRTSTLITPVS